MAFVKIALSGLSAIFVACLGPELLFTLKSISTQEATGAAFVRIGLPTTLFAPRFWILAISFFVLFFAASRLGNKTLRVIFFWTPTILISTLGLSLFSLLAYMGLYSRKS